MPGRLMTSGLLTGTVVVWILLAIRPRQDATPPPPLSPPSSPPAIAKQPDAPGDKLIIRPDHPVRWSTKCDREELRALKTGRRRLGISVNAYEPPKPEAEGFVVYLRSANGMKRQEIDRFTLHPSKSFRVANGATPQRFLIDLADVPEPWEDSRLILEVGFDSSSGKLQGGFAEVSFEFVDLN